MQNVVSLAREAAACLFVTQALLVAARSFSCVRRSVAFLLCAFLLCSAALLALPPGTTPHETTAVALICTGGAFLRATSGRRGMGFWVGACVAVVFTLLIGQALGNGSALQYRVLRALLLAGLAAVVLRIHLAMAAGRRSPAAWGTLGAGCAWLLSAGLAVIAPSFGPAADLLASLSPLLFSCCTGWVIFQEGYPRAAAWRGALAPLGARQGAVSLYQRLLAAEDALAAQARIETAGFLALGAAHEFKNTLSLVKLAAQHGLARPDPQAKDECLRLIEDHTRTARDSAVGLLDKLSADGAGPGRVLDAARDLSGCIRRAGTLLRPEGIVMDVHLEEGVRFQARRFDVEQIVVNLIQNAADGYSRRHEEDGRPVTVRACVEGETAVIEVRDAAGGVPDGVRARLFSPSASGSGSTGFGLYLSRNLARANGGELDYLPVDGGSAFRLSLPLADK